MQIDTTQRDKKARRLILTAVKLASGYAARGGLSGASLLDQVNGSMAWDQQIDADDCVRMVREMETAGYLRLELGTIRRGELFGLKHLDVVAISPKGLDLYVEKLPPDPLIDDERLEA
jgi:hypothetical protein